MPTPFDPYMPQVQGQLTPDRQQQLGALQTALFAALNRDQAASPTGGTPTGALPGGPGTQGGPGVSPWQQFAQNRDPTSFGGNRGRDGPAGAYNFGDGFGGGGALSDILGNRFVNPSLAPGTQAGAGSGTAPVGAIDFDAIRAGLPGRPTVGPEGEYTADRGFSIASPDLELQPRVVSPFPGDYSTYGQTGAGEWGFFQNAPGFPGASGAGPTSGTSRTFEGDPLDVNAVNSFVGGVNAPFTTDEDMLLQDQIFNPLSADYAGTGQFEGGLYSINQNYAQPPTGIPSYSLTSPAGFNPNPVLQSQADPNWWDDRSLFGASPSQLSATGIPIHTQIGYVQPGQQETPMGEWAGIGDMPSGNFYVDPLTGEMVNVGTGAGANEVTAGGQLDLQDYLDFPASSEVLQTEADQPPVTFGEKLSAWASDPITILSGALNPVLPLIYGAGKAILDPYSSEGSRETPGTPRTIGSPTVSYQSPEESFLQKLNPFD